MVVLAADGHEDLANVDTGDLAVRLAEGTTHTGLQSIGTGAGKHLVDTDDVEGVHTDTQVERLLACLLHDILVGGDTGSLESLRGHLFVFVGNKAVEETRRALVSWSVIEVAQLGLTERRRGTRQRSPSFCRLENATE